MTRWRLALLTIILIASATAVAARWWRHPHRQPVYDIVFEGNTFVPGKNGQMPEMKIIIGPVPKFGLPQTTTPATPDVPE